MVCITLIEGFKPMLYISESSFQKVQELKILICKTQLIAVTSRRCRTIKILESVTSLYCRPFSSQLIIQRFKIFYRIVEISEVFPESVRTQNLDKPWERWVSQERRFWQLLEYDCFNIWDLMNSSQLAKRI